MSKQNYCFDDNTIAKHLSLLVDVIGRKRWQVFSNIVLDKPDVFRTLCNTFPKYFNGMTLLHVCLCFDPPLGVVFKMLAMLQEDRQKHLIYVQDSMARTPLLVAVEYNANPLTIELLAKVESAAQMSSGCTAISDALSLMALKSNDALLENTSQYYCKS